MDVISVIIMGFAVLVWGAVMFALIGVAALLFPGSKGNKRESK